MLIFEIVGVVLALLVLAPDAVGRTNRQSLMPDQ